MRDPRCWRELAIRGGMTFMLAAIAYFVLDGPGWIWWLPVFISAMVLLRWALRPKNWDEEEEQDEDLSI
jgi:hypothetical protein